MVHCDFLLVVCPVGTLAYLLTVVTGKQQHNASIENVNRHNSTLSRRTHTSKDV